MTNRLKPEVPSESASTLRLREGEIEAPHRNACAGGFDLK
jgi:hypothetical protein